MDNDRNGRSQPRSKKFYIYDTFTGLVPQYSSAADFPGAPQYLEHIDKEYRASDIEGCVRDRFRNKDYVVVTKGVVPDALQEIAPERIAFLHLDSPATALVCSTASHWAASLFSMITVGSTFKITKRLPTGSWRNGPGDYGTADRPRFDDQALAVFSAGRPNLQGRSEQLRRGEQLQRLGAMPNQPRLDRAIGELTVDLRRLIECNR